MENNYGLPEDLLNELEVVAVTGETCDIIFQDSRGVLTNVSAAVQQLLREEEGLILVLDNNLSIKSADLVSINGFVKENLA